MQVISIRGARQNNLKNVDLDIPRRALVVVSGPSGSGKSSLVFDTLYAEGQRRYVESLSTYTKQFLERMEKPDVDEILGISPAIAIRQQNHVKTARSTVGTATEVYDYLRLLFARVGIQHCPGCGEPVRAASPTSGARRVLEEFAAGARVVVLFALPTRAGTDAAAAVEALRAAGFTRWWDSGTTRDLDDLAGVPGGGALEVVVDRIALRADVRTRLAEGLETALRAGDGFAAVVDATSGVRLELSSRPLCPRCRIDLPEPTPTLFSFNSPLGACPECRGFGNRLEFDERLIVPDPEATISGGALAPWATPKFEYYQRKMEDWCQRNQVPVRTPWYKLPRDTQRLLLDGAKGFKGVRPFLEALRAKSYKKYARFFTRRFMDEVTCSACQGTRLRREALYSRVGGHDLAQLGGWSLGALHDFVTNLELAGEAQVIAADIVAELRARLGFLCEIGVEYLTLDRLTRTLSGGEAQRINLANSMGANLVDALYVLDEPTVGMHPRDTRRLLGTLQHLRDLGNSVVLVEHDLEVVAAADWLVDMGPGAGSQGGEIVYAGPGPAAQEPPALPVQGAADASRTLAYVTGAAEILPPAEPRKPAQRWIELVRVRRHNLKDVHARFPLGLLTCVSGVSGSGKSTLIGEVLFEALERRLPPDRGQLGSYDELRGAHLVHGVTLVDQSPIGRTPRSNPLSYMKGLADVRAIFAATREARLRRLEASAFSFNTPGGRCEACEGMGYVQIEMHFMADVFVRCEHCEGQRFGPHVLEVRYRGRHIAEVLQMTVDEALSFFHDAPALGEKLYVLKRVGLGYLRLGQPAPTLSGGESQRLKIARALAQKGESNMLYLLDEPTTGLHPDDVAKLLRVLHELVDRGHSAIVVEHNLDVVRSADWVIDLGPEAGAGGGEIVYAGPAAGLALETCSWTGRCLAEAAARSAAAATDSSTGRQACGSS